MSLTSRYSILTIWVIWTRGELNTINSTTKRWPESHFVSFIQLSALLLKHNTPHYRTRNYRSRHCLMCERLALQRKNIKIGYLRYTNSSIIFRWGHLPRSLLNLLLSYGNARLQRMLDGHQNHWSVQYILHTTHIVSCQTPCCAEQFYQHYIRGTPRTCRLIQHLLILY